MTSLPRPADERIQFLKSVPFLLVHLAPIGLFFTGIRPRDLVLIAVLYVTRIFFITAGFHRYFAHRTYKTSRVMQFLLAFGGMTSLQKGVLWWAGHHRVHHKYSDTDRDVHSPKRGLFWSHVGWILCRKYQHTEWNLIKDFAKYPELVWLNKYHVVPGVILGAGCFLYGGWSALWAFFLSTVLVYHGTFTVNSFTHVWGSRRYATTDTSKNSLLIALITLGEGWHNNHHYYQSSTNQGFFWWELDISYYVLRLMSLLGLVRDLRTPPRHVLQRNRLERNRAKPKPRAASPELAQRASRASPAE